MPEQLNWVTDGEVEGDAVEAPTNPAPDRDEPGSEGPELEMGLMQSRQPGADRVH